MLGDRYRVVARLGVGGMGEVFRADDLKLGQPVALKFLPESVERDPVRLDKFTAEVRTARQISHPNVCRVYDVGEIDGRRFLTMEYVDGEDLRGLLRRIGRLPEDKGLEIARQICAGLAAIHDRGVLHRDLKPANIMLDGRGRVRLTDFGLATATVGAGTDGEIAGTPAYMAPEQLAGQPLSTSTDLYALGLVLFELFTGERVQKGDDAGAIRDAQKSAQATLTTSASGAKLDPIVQRVIERCLDRDPARRPQSAIVVAAALPGGDPLAAALAAGETPSPQMVAAAGEEGGLPFKIAGPLLVALMVGVILVLWQQGRGSYTSKVNFPNSPEVLASKASELLVRLGYTEPVVGQASGFRDDLDYSKWLDDHDKTATRWQHVASVRPPMVRFWHRTSPVALIPQKYFGHGAGGGLAANVSDPALTAAGMTYLELDPAGRLVAFDAVVPDHTATTAAPSTPDWSALFREAGLEQAAFKSAAPEWVARSASDARAAWVGPGADATGGELRVEAAAFQGRPVFFKLVAPWTQPDRDAAKPPTGAEKAGFAIVVIVLLGVPTAAIALSLRNLKLGRMDTRGATRLAVAGGSVVLLAAVLGSDMPTDVGWIENSFILASWAAFSALLIWTFYAAVEPYVRRRWPQMLISWSRLLDGRWRDPLVGRDLLVGSVLGLAVNQLVMFRAVVDRWRGEPPPLPTPNISVWMGLRLAAAEAIASLPAAVWLALGIVVLLVVLRLLLRREWAAAAGFVVIFAGPNLLEGTNPLVAALFEGVTSLIFVIVATRFGLIMFAAVLLMGPFLTRVGGFSDPSFLMGGVWLGIAVAVAPGVFGFFTATRGRKKTAWLDG